MKSFAELLHERAVRNENPENLVWREAKYHQIRQYFLGEIDLPQLRRAIGGYSSFRLVGMTSPQTEEWSLLHSALDILLEDAGVRETEAGWMTADEYLDAMAASQQRGKYAKVPFGGSKGRSYAW